MKLFVRIILVFVILVFTATLVSCKNYDYEAFSSEAFYLSMDERQYAEYLSEGKAKNENRDIVLTALYFQDNAYNEKNNSEPLSFEAIESDEEQERFLAFYAFICDFYDTYEYKTKNWSSRQIEVYNDDFFKTLNSEARNCRTKYPVVYRMVSNAQSYLTPKNGFDTSRVSFRNEYNELWCFSIDADGKINNKEKSSVFEKARDLYETKTAKEALELLKSIKTEPDWT